MTPFTEAVLIFAVVLWPVALFMRWAYHRNDSEVHCYQFPDGTTLHFTGYTEAVCDQFAFDYWEMVSQ